MYDFKNTKTKIISCATIEDEVNLVIHELNLKLDSEIKWIESKFHNNPGKLKVEIQNSIDSINENVDNILLLYGSCGNAMDGVKSDKYKLICMKVDDCFAMLLGGTKERIKDKGSYYFTKRYIESECSLWHDYCRCQEKYGNKKTEKIYKRMLKEYKSIKVIDTGAYNLEDILNKTKEIARCCDLEHQIILGNLNILVKALTKSWDEDFIIKERNEEISFNDFENIKSYNI